MPSELETVLASWLREASSPIGQLPAGVTPAAWVAEQLAAWWKQRGGGALDDVEAFAQRIEASLVAAGGWKNASLGEAMEDVTHLREAIEHLRTLLALDSSPPTPAPD
jgi:hypothetical protein